MPLSDVVLKLKDTDSRKSRFPAKVVGHWTRLPREAVDAPSLEVFKVRLDGALSDLISQEMSLPMAGGLDWMIFEGPSHPKRLDDHV